MTHLLLAMLAPGSAEAEIGRVQQRIFADHGLVSAIALPPLAPVAFLPSELPASSLPGFLSRLNASVAAPYRLTFRDARWQEGWLYLAFDSGGIWESLRAAALPETPGLFPAFEGFFLGCGESEPGLRGRISPSLPAGGFTSSSLALLRITTGDRGSDWWREVSTETLEERPLRGRRRT